jgi:hypothetical protein
LYELNEVIEAAVLTFSVVIMSTIYVMVVGANFMWLVFGMSMTSIIPPLTGLTDPPCSANIVDLLAINSNTRSVLHDLDVVSVLHAIVRVPIILYDCLVLQPACVDDGAAVCAVLAVRFDNDRQALPN